MSALITADFQAEWANLDLCTQAWSQALGICSKYDVHLLIVLGDGKQVYNPVDGRVILWWQNAIRKAKRQGIICLYVLGNHDRFGQYTDTDNWLPVLRRAGAITYDTPGVYQDKDRRFFILPFAGVAATKDGGQKLLRENPDKDTDVLLFHQDIKGAKYNAFNTISDGQLTTDNALFASHYKFCIGGHIHNPQKVKDNVYYVGSPFCTDWGEVNQRKRFLLLQERKLTSIDSTVPGWQDPGLPGFNPSSSYEGSRIRLKVKIRDSDSGRYGSILNKAYRRAERKYPGAEVTVVPEFLESDSLVGVISATDNDKQKIISYVLTRKSKASKRVVEYMLSKLSEVSGGLRKGTEIEFIKAWGNNVLSFKDVTVDFSKQGITLVEGVNKDRGGKSNGSGKTNLTQLPAVTMFGRTFKEQTHDRWANRWTGERKVTSGIKLRSDNKTLKIIRGRRPPVLKMFVNGKNQSSGMKSNDRNGTQNQIEQVTGFTWQTLANAVYIDRTIAEAFLSGTKKQRTEVLSRFQNLERFAKASDLVKQDLRDTQARMDSTSAKLFSTIGKIKECLSNLSEVKDEAKLELTTLYDDWKSAKKVLRRWQRKNKRVLNSFVNEEKRYATKYTDANKVAYKAEVAHAACEVDSKKVSQELTKWMALRDSKECPLCLQQVSKSWIKSYDHDLLKKSTKLKSKLLSLRTQMVESRKHTHLLEAKHDNVSAKCTKLEREEKNLLVTVQETERRYKEAFDGKNTSANLIVTMKNKLKSHIVKKRRLKRKVKKLTRKLKMFDFVLEAFSRDGIPAFLNAQLCPVLNKAADYYAELFSDKEIQLRFVIEDGDFVPLVINDKGGAGVGDQSDGEKALAGLIASFALREVAPRCNLLILDEPGTGLDDQTIKQFAKALRILVKRFKSIWITTHNQTLLSELSSERTILVRKKNRISKVIAA